MQGQPPPSQRLQDHINSGGFQERFFPAGHHWRGGSDRGAIQVPGLQHRYQVGLATERPGPLEEGQPAAVLHEEAESFSACPKLLELFHVSTTVSAEFEPLSLQHPQRTGLGMAVQGCCC